MSSFFVFFLLALMRNQEFFLFGPMFKIDQKSKIPGSFMYQIWHKCENWQIGVKTSRVISQVELHCFFIP